MTQTDVNKTTTVESFWDLVKRHGIEVTPEDLLRNANKSELSDLPGSIVFGILNRCRWVALRLKLNNAQDFHLVMVGEIPSSDMPWTIFDNAGISIFGNLQINDELPQCYFATMTMLIENGRLNLKDGTEIILS